MSLPPRSLLRGRGRITVNLDSFEIDVPKPKRHLSTNAGALSIATFFRGVGTWIGASATFGVTVGAVVEETVNNFHLRREALRVNGQIRFVAVVVHRENPSHARPL
jgi:hypothetical protein